MSQKDVAFALELVARALNETSETDTSMFVASRLIDFAGILNAAPVSDGFVRCASVDDGPCTYHPLGGPDCGFAM